MTQIAFSKQLGVSRSYLSEVENEKGKPSIEMIVGIASEFPDVDLRWVLTGKDISSNQPALDMDVLGNCLEVIEWALKEVGKENPDPRKKVELLLATYDLYMEIGGEVDKKTLMRLVKVAA